MDWPHFHFEMSHLSSLFLVCFGEVGCYTIWLSSPTRYWTHVSCIGRWILNPWTTREVLFSAFLRTVHSVLHSGRTNLHSRRQCRGVPFSSCSFQHLLFADSVMKAILSIFDLHFSNNQRCRASFHVPDGHLGLLGRNVLHCWLCL